MTGSGDVPCLSCACSKAASHAEPTLLTRLGKTASVQLGRLAGHSAIQWKEVLECLVGSHAQATGKPAKSPHQCNSKDVIHEEEEHEEDGGGHEDEAHCRLSGYHHHVRWCATALPMHTLHNPCVIVFWGVNATPEKHFTSSDHDNSDNAGLNKKNKNKKKYNKKVTLSRIWK